MVHNSLCVCPGKDKAQEIYMFSFIGWKVHMMTPYLLLMTFFYQWNLSRATLMEEVCGPRGEQYWKINLIWWHTTRVSWLGYKFFSRPSYILIYHFIYSEAAGINVISNVLIFLQEEKLFQLFSVQMKTTDICLCFQVKENLEFV